MQLSFANEAMASFAAAMGVMKHGAIRSREIESAGTVVRTHMDELARIAEDAATLLDNTAYAFSQQRPGRTFVKDLRMAAAGMRQTDPNSSSVHWIGSVFTDDASALARLSTTGEELRPYVHDELDDQIARWLAQPDESIRAAIDGVAHLDDALQRATSIPLAQNA
jgi:hypothetical protein